MSQPAPTESRPVLASQWEGRNRFVYETARLVLTAVMRLYIVRFYVEGQNRVPPTGSVMLMSNHQSKVDPFLIAWPVSRPVAIPGKAMLFRLPLVGPLLRALGGYPVDRDVADVRSLRTSIQVLRSGSVLGVFPEGHRSWTGEIMPFMPTLTKIAIRHQVPVVPVAVCGSRDFLARGKVVPRPWSRLVIVYGEPIDLARWHGARLTDADLADATTLIRDRVVALYERADTLRENRRIFEGRLG